MENYRIGVMVGDAFVYFRVAAYTLAHAYEQAAALSQHFGALPGSSTVEPEPL